MSRWIAKTCDLETCLMLRRVVFIEEQQVPEEDELDEYDQSAIHLLAFEEDEPVGTARIVVNGTIGKIGRVCVLQAHRDTGLGKDLILAALDQLRTISGVTTAQLGAQTQATGFYENLGFKSFGPAYMDAGILHIDMKRVL